MQSYLTNRLINIDWPFPSAGPSVPNSWSLSGAYKDSVEYWKLLEASLRPASLTRRHKSFDSRQVGTISPWKIHSIFHVELASCAIST